MRDVQQHDAIDAETEQHGRRAGGRGRELRAGEPERAEHDERATAPDGSDPTATSQRLRKTMNSSGRISDERADGVPDALALDDRFGFHRDAMAAGELDPQRRLRLVVVAGILPRSAAAPTARRWRVSRASSARENSASYGGRFGRAITSRLRPSGVT